MKNFILGITTIFSGLTKGVFIGAVIVACFLLLVCAGLAVDDMIHGW